MLSKLALIWGHPFVIQILADNVLKILQMVQCSRRGGLDGKQFLWLPQQIAFSEDIDSAQSLSWNSACSFISVRAFQMADLCVIEIRRMCESSILIVAKQPQSFPVSVMTSIMIEKSRAGHISMKFSVCK